jgi:hypothetical protein
MQFRLPWSGVRPHNDRLQLFVRYTCEDGRVLETEREIRVQPSGRTAQRWTPRSTPSPERSGKREAVVARQSPATEAEPTVVQAVAEIPIAVPPENPSTPETSSVGEDAHAPRSGQLWKPNR